jgi:flagellar capping protein FliD
LSMWTAIALIAIAGIVGEAYRHHAKDKLSKADHQSIDALNRRLDTLETDLKKRVETLERIVVDRSENLKRKFDHLDKAG